MSGVPTGRRFAYGTTTSDQADREDQDENRKAKLNPGQLRMSTASMLVPGRPFLVNSVTHDIVKLLTRYSRPRRIDPHGRAVRTRPEVLDTVSSTPTSAGSARRRSVARRRRRLACDRCGRLPTGAAPL